MTAAERDVGNDQWDHDGENRGRDAVEYLNGDQQVRIAD